MHDTNAPSRQELLGRATELVPLLNKNAQWIEENRRLPEDVVTALTDAGLLKMRVPRHFGGYESPMRTVAGVIAELARGDGSTGWTAAVWAISSWMAGMFPDEVQEEVFAEPDVRVSGILSPTAVGTPVDGGITLNGKWGFNTGSLQSSWNTNAAVRARPDGSFEPIMVLIPLSELTVVDDWHTAGMRGSGSVSTVARDLFVPEQRVLSMPPVLAGTHQPGRNAASPVYKAPFMPTACTTVAAVALGLARAAREAFFQRLPGRKISYTAYENQAEAPITHLTTADAVTRIDEAGFHVLRAAGMLDDKAAAGEAWTLEERARARLDLGAATQRSKEAVGLLNSASGGSSVYSTVPIQRIQRDVQTLTLHAIMHPATNLELYGRVLCGLDPNTHYI
ncbi:acyl-CoA dehydrogenase [Streptomyces sp. NRRL B-1677]|uniref:acyl-CoA dehydrogenase family protein n=1 Tax=Streptomyces sp. NRRL B-1677 TaxID=2682966 RepID=UPI001892C18C|nr:acyl-CoA dehydrogenase family protein [Streptomyces sp. NRRL B-1677]MBF6049151.1 acyl-CoA dehydrogenase [Streptomyces sp. NRRL B-1677]